jgi:septum formation protein
MTTPLPLLLASSSPRRRQLLQLLGLPFTVAVPPADEDEALDRYRGPIEELAEWLAKYKAAAALTLPEASGRLVITADTTVLLDQEVLGKPRDKAHARELLLTLRGRRHYVVTGVAVSYLEIQRANEADAVRLAERRYLEIQRANEADASTADAVRLAERRYRANSRHHIESASCITPVLMRSYSEEEIDSYIASGDPLDKAGAYGVQHPGFLPTKRIDGCYLNVVGLPLCVLVDLLAEFDVYPVIQNARGKGCPWSEKCLT